MLTEMQDRDTIFSSAIEIASAAERDAYILRACGDDAELRRQVQERVAAHFKARNTPNEPSVAAAAGARHQAGTHQADHHEDPPQATSSLWNGARKHPRAFATAAVLLLLAAVAGSGSVAVWAWRAEERARTSVQQAVDERDRAQKAAEEAKEQRDHAEEEKRSMAQARDQALAAEQAAQRSAEDTKAVLAFLQNNVLSAGRPKGWAGGEWAGGTNKDVTLRKAVDTAESEVAKTFADRPLAEASIREALGSAYLDLGEAALAVKQFERALALREALLGPDHSDTGDSRNKLAKAYRYAGRTTEAGRLYDQDLASPARAATLAVRGALLLSQKKPVEAELKLRECLAIRQKIQPDDWSTFDTKAMLGEALVEQKKYADAEPLLLSGYEGLKQRQDKIPSADKVRLTKALEHLVQLYEGWGKKDKAGQWRKELETTKAATET